VVGPVDVEDHLRPYLGRFALGDALVGEVGGAGLADAPVVEQFGAVLVAEDDRAERRLGVPVLLGGPLDLGTVDPEVGGEEVEGGRTSWQVLSAVGAADRSRTRGGLSVAR
jgi:hypothetical protein